MLAADRKTRSAVERQFEIVGEAMARLERHDAATAEKITGIRGIIGFRNQIAHGYDTLDLANVDAVIRDFLPILLKETGELLEAGD